MALNSNVINNSGITDCTAFPEAARQVQSPPNNLPAPMRKTPSAPKADISESSTLMTGNKSANVANSSSSNNLPAPMRKTKSAFEADISETSAPAFKKQKLCKYDTNCRYMYTTCKFGHSVLPIGGGAVVSENLASTCLESSSSVENLASSISIPNRPCKFGKWCRKIDSCNFTHPNELDKNGNPSASIFQSPTDKLVNEALRELVNDPNVDIESLYFKNMAEDGTYKPPLSNLSCVLLGYCDDINNIDPKCCSRRLISLYNKYCSDHALVLTNPKSLESSVCVSFNVEHNAHALRRIMRFVNSVNSNCGGDPKNMVLSQERINVFVEKIFAFKNKKIQEVISEVVSKYCDRIIVINLQEVSPSLFVWLGNNLRGLKCRMTKLIPQHVVEVLLDYDREQLENLGLVGDKPKDIAGIERYISSLDKKIPSTYNPDRHRGRFSINGSFLSLVHQPEEDYLNIWFDHAIRPKSEEDFATLAAIANRSLSNQAKFLRSRPVMLHTQICGVTSGLLHNGVMLGSFFVSCRGILVEDYGVINYHGHTKLGSTERLLNAINNDNPSNIADLLDVFEHDFSEDRNFVISESPTMYIGLATYNSLLDSYMSTLPSLTTKIGCIGGDFNMPSDKFHLSGVNDWSEELVGSYRHNANDRIVWCAFECDNYTPIVRLKTILAESDIPDGQAPEDQTTETNATGVQITEAEDSE